LKTKGEKMEEQKREIQKTIAQYVLRSAGTCNHLSNHTVTCFVGMIETGDATWDDFRAVGGQELVDTIQKRWEVIQ
jgi:hypothetical protein